MAIVFLGTPAFSVPSLRRLVDDGYDVAAVYSQPDRPAGRGRRSRPPPTKQAAQEMGLTVRQPESLRDPAAIEELRALKPELGIAVAYGQILRPEVLEVPQRGVLNVHPSLLPKLRGASPISAAILNGDRESGVSVILMDPGMDSGPIIAQRRLPIEDRDTAGTLSERLAALAAELLSEALPRWLSGEIQPQTQDHSQATKAPPLKKDHGRIDWTLPAVDIWRRVRAYNPWPGAYTTLDGELLHVWQAWPLPDSDAPPGAVVALTDEQRTALPDAADREAFGVATGDGLLAVLSVQRAGRKAMPAADFLRGMRDLIGKRLGD